MRQSRRLCAVLLGVVVLLPGSAHVAQAAPEEGGYAQLVALFGEWRQFQQPRMEAGVPDYSAAAMAAQQTRLPEFQRRLRAIDRSGFSVSLQVDFLLVRGEMNGLEFDQRVLRPWARQPGFYAGLVADQSDTPGKEGPAFAGTLELWRYTFPLPASQLTGFRQKLQALPKILEQARGNLIEDARDLWLLGIRDHRAQSKLLADLEARLAKAHADLVPDVQRARLAEDAFVGWLEARLPDKHGRSGVGVENYDWYLKNVHLLPHAWRDEVALMERELGRALAHLALEQGHNRALPALEPIATPEEWQRRMQASVTEYMSFLRDKHVVTVTDDMEPALRARVPSFSPEGERDFFAQVEARQPLLLRCHGYHWFDLARMERTPHPSPVRKGPLLYNIWDSRAEGLATAMEELMSSAGLFDAQPRSRELVYVMVAQRAARALAALKVHSHELTLEQAVRFAHERTPFGWLKLDGDLVWGEQGLYLTQPGYGSSYLGGKARLEALLGERAQKLGAAFTLQGFMDELNAAGMIPVPLIRYELTGQDDEVRRLE